MYTILGTVKTVSNVGSDEPRPLTAWGGPKFNINNYKFIGTVKKTQLEFICPTLEWISYFSLAKMKII